MKISIRTESRDCNEETEEQDLGQHVEMDVMEQDCCSTAPRTAVLDNAILPVKNGLFMPMGS
jgi:hypothetical protein